MVDKIQDKIKNPNESINYDFSQAFYSLKRAKIAIDRILEQ